MQGLGLCNCLNCLLAEPYEHIMTTILELPSLGHFHVGTYKKKCLIHYLILTYATVKRILESKTTVPLALHFHQNKHCN